METISLNGIWALTGRKEGTNDAPLSLTATVPGCVQLDLAEAGYLPKDLFMGENVKATEAYEEHEWWYERRFTAPDARKNVYLVFEGVDCIAEYYLNGQRIGESDNMLIPHEFEVGQYLADGENVLTVHLRSPMRRAREYDYTIKVLSGSPVTTESRYIRKARHSYGWDIMPRAVTAGLWRGVRLEVRDRLWFSQLFFHTPRSGTVYYALAGDVNAEGLELELEGGCGDSRFKVRNRLPFTAGYFHFGIPNPKKWFPYGYGEANVYDGVARIYADGVAVHEEAFSFGIREVVLDRADILPGKEGRFRFLINGVEIMCRGSNWVPLDAFHSRDAGRYAEALALVKDSGCNILRCWGGNVYEDHTFFDYCDRNGIMVWQDFSMACSYYPEDEDFKRRLREEATSVVRRFRNHPSIILWAGDNECDSVTQRLGDPNTNSLTRVVLPKVVEENDPSRTFLPSSPYISTEVYASGGRSQTFGSTIIEDHLWGPRDYFKSDYYKNNGAAFVSETGYHGCPALASIRKFITPERVWPYTDNPEWILHSSDQRGSDHRVMLMEKQVRQLFGEVPTEPEDYILASQISQAEAKKYFIERIRVGRPKKTGIIWWNLLDGWPQMSDAVVDYYFRKKLAYFYIKRAQAPFSVAAGEMENWRLPIYACNDTLKEYRGHLTITDAETGEELFSSDFTAAPNATTRLANLPLYYSDQRLLLFKWESEDGRGWNHHLCGYPPFSFARYRRFLESYMKDECDEAFGV